MVEPRRPARLWYQSFVHPKEQATYIDRLQGALDKAAAPVSASKCTGLILPTIYFIRSPNI
jgi:hypothetical protein